MGNLFYIGGTDRIAFRDYDEAVKWCKNRTPWNEEQIKEKIMECNFEDEVRKLCELKQNKMERFMENKIEYEFDLGTDEEIKNFLKENGISDISPDIIRDYINSSMYKVFCETIYSKEQLDKLVDTVKVKEVIHAKWEWFNAWDGDDTFGEWKMLRCSNCLGSEGARENAKFCSECGAIMDL